MIAIAYFKDLIRNKNSASSAQIEHCYNRMITYKKISVKKITPFSVGNFAIADWCYEMFLSGGLRPPLKNIS
jgi:hypothetical protein